MVTGGAGGIGAAIARRLGREGATVVIADFDIAAAMRTVAELEREGLAAIALEIDVTSESAWAAVCAQVLARFGSLDILVNNAGIAIPPPDGFEALSLADWKRVMSVNLDGVFLGTREGVRIMKDRSGAIVNIGSVAAYIGTPGGAAYGASKGGVRALTKQAAVACARKGYKVRINAIHPSWIWTPLVEKAVNARFGAERGRAALAELHPFKQIGEAEDVANAVLFLASDEARFINGADLVIDAGLLST
jgi:3(or 17)beta-hydroxysteroid dehydrogenase